MTNATFPLKTAIIGAGHRSMIYADYALKNPDKMKITAVAEPDKTRREHAAKLHNIPNSMTFQCYTDMLKNDNIAQAAINGTMDSLHFDSTMALLNAGMHILLEKPIANTQTQIHKMIDTAESKKRIVMICHVLRYAPFYQKIKRLLEKGTVGSIISMHTSENVSYHHMATAFIRGKWNRREVNPILLAKCCHDTDIITWLMAPQKPAFVSSTGSLMQFKPENAPAGAGKRCLVDCKIESQCQYSCKFNYITKNFWSSYYAFADMKNPETATQQQKLDYLQDVSPYGRCVWHCDNDVVDHQCLWVEFDNGAIATHNLLCSTARPARTIHIIGSEGEIEGDLEYSKIIVRKPALDTEGEYSEQTVTVQAEDAAADDGHGGGDIRVVESFVSAIQKSNPTQRDTLIRDSLAGHLIAFAADEAMQLKLVIKLKI